MILDVEADPSGGIWIGTAAGLVRFDGTNWMVYNQANTGMPGIVVADVARRSSDGLIAIASNQGSTWPYTGGVSTFNGATWTHYTPKNSPLTHWQVVAVEFDANGNLWASPLSTGVVQIMIGNTPTPTPINANRYPNSHSDSHSNCDTNSNRDAKANCDTNCYSDAKANRNTETSFHAATTVDSKNIGSQLIIA